jgi:hypothetical protein
MTTPSSCLNWPLIAGAALLTLVILAGLAATAWAILAPQDKAHPALDQTSGLVRTNMPAEAIEPRPPIAQDQLDPLLLRLETVEPEKGTSHAILPVPLTKPQTEDKRIRLEQPPAPCQKYGTSVEFHGSQTEAARAARRDGKLLFMLHISGNFEDAQFT